MFSIYITIRFMLLECVCTRDNVGGGGIKAFRCCCFLEVVVIVGYGNAMKIDADVVEI